MFGLTDTDIAIITAVFLAHSEIESVVVFGSRAMGNYKPGSDVDLALKGGAVSDEVAGTVWVELNERSPLPYKFDVVAYTDRLDAALKEHIDSCGKILYRREVI